MKKSSSQANLGSPSVLSSIRPTQIPNGIQKTTLDNRSRQLNPENTTFWRSRNTPRPVLKAKTR